MFKNKTVLVTGGSGSIGREIIKGLIKEKPKQIRVYSRDETKHWEMQQDKTYNYAGMRYIIGNIRDKDKLFRAMNRVDYVFHCAALKHVPSCEYNVDECWKTNIEGTHNVVESCIQAGVKKAIMISTDKAADPYSTMGVSKLMAERIFRNTYNWYNRTLFCVGRMGNVWGSRGSIGALLEDVRAGDRIIIPITDERMMRYWTTKERAATFFIEALKKSKHGGELYIPTEKTVILLSLKELLETVESVYSIIIERQHIGARYREKIEEVLEGECEVLIEGEYLYTKDTTMTITELLKR